LVAQLLNNVSQQVELWKKQVRAHQT